MIEKPEGREVEYKRSANNLRADSFVAFANGRGGVILIGVDEQQNSDGLQSGDVVGCDISDEARLSIGSRAASCRPSIEVEITVENSGSPRPIIRVDVAEGSRKPYCTSSGTYKIRSDSQNIAIDPVLMTAMILEREAEQFVTRFQSAAETVLRRLNDMQRSLEGQIATVELAARDATEAAENAEQVATDAIDAVYDAVSDITGY